MNHAQLYELSVMAETKKMVQVLLDFKANWRDHSYFRDLTSSSSSSYFIYSWLVRFFIVLVKQRAKTFRFSMTFMCHEQILQLQFEPSHLLIFSLNEFTLDNCLKLLPRVFQI